MQPAEFPWDKIRTLQPTAYAALFDTAPNVALFTQGDTPYQWAEYSSQLAREAGDAVDYMRDFHLRDLYEFFDNHGLSIAVHPGHEPDMVEVSWNLMIIRPDGIPVIGRKQLGCTSRDTVELYAFINAFALLEEQLPKAAYDGNDVEPSAGTPAV